MKRIYISILFMVCLMHAQGQVLTQDSKGNSSVLFNGSNIGFDITEAAINFSFNKFQNEIDTNRGQKLVWGFNLQAKNNDGYANVFTEGILSPAAKGNITLGYTITSGKSTYCSILENKRTEKTNALNNLTIKLIAKIKKIIDTVPDGYNHDTLRMIKAKMNLIVSQTPIEQIDSTIREVTYSFQMNYTSLINGIANRIEVEYSAYIVKYKTTDLDRVKIDSTISVLRGYYRSRISIFFTGGFTSNAFKLQKEIDTANFNNTFKNQGFLGYDCKIGINWHYGGKWLLAGTLGYKQNNNFEELTKIEYILTKTMNSGNQQLATQNKVTAYSGDYSTFNQTKIEVDVLRFIKMAENVLVLDLYYRNAISDKPSTFPNITDIGFSAYFFKNKGLFLGGLYIEAPDINNNIEKAKENPQIKPIENKLNFGIVAKINIGSIYGN